MKILIVGAGGHGQVVADILQAQRVAGDDVDVIGFVDDDPSWKVRTAWEDRFWATSLQSRGLGMTPWSWQWETTSGGRVWTRTCGVRDKDSPP